MYSGNFASCSFVKAFNVEDFSLASAKKILIVRCVNLTDRAALENVILLPEAAPLRVQWRSSFGFFWNDGYMVFFEDLLSVDNCERGLGVH
jgi:hypothetical protein